MRASYYLLGALLGRMNKAEVALPGGCNFGTRPIDLHEKGFRALGATVEIEDGIVYTNAQELCGSTIYLDTVSVGATINIMLAAVLAKGRTVFTIAHRLTTIKNASYILVLTENGIEEMGTHKELMEKGGIYHELYSMYSVM